MLKVDVVVLVVVDVGKLVVVVTKKVTRKQLVSVRRQLVADTEISPSEAVPEAKYSNKFINRFFKTVSL